ncbi:hypothetical protein BH11PSE1_BH11PSE1_17440 [soil metagenome]
MIARALLTLALLTIPALARAQEDWAEVSGSAEAVLHVDRESVVSQDEDGDGAEDYRVALTRTMHLVPGASVTSLEVHRIRCREGQIAVVSTERRDAAGALTEPESAALEPSYEPAAPGTAAAAELAYVCGLPL